MLPILGAPGPKAALAMGETRLLDAADFPPETPSEGRPLAQPLGNCLSWMSPVIVPDYPRTWLYAVQCGRNFLK